MRYTILPFNVNVKMTPEILQDQGKMQRGIKSAFTRAKIDWIGILPGTLFCAWCDRPNSSIIFNLSLHGTTASISHGGYVKNLRCCYSPNCEYKKLNPNSVEFVSKSRGITEDEAIKYIHERNISPFYRHNHGTEDAYIKYQGSRCFNGDEERDKLIIKKQNHARSLQGFIEKFGEEGRDKWNKVQNQKGITLKNLTRKHGANALQKLILWKNSVSCSKENFIRRHGEVAGVLMYKETIQKHGYYSPVTFTPSGSALRSNLERNFYQVLIDSGLTEDEDFLIDGNYPNSGQRYDFWFPKIGIYLEVCGSTTKEYRDKMQQKKRDFGAVLVQPGKILKVTKEMADLCLFQSKRQIP